MNALVSAVFVASLLGSTHCAGMCGAFLAVAVAPPPGAESTGGSFWRSRLAALGAYNGGRLVTYAVLGAIAGAVGAALDLGGSMVGLQQTAAILAGAAILCFGVIAVLRQLNVPIARAPVPAALRNVVIRAHRAGERLPPLTRAAVIGLLTTLLPCGWLWAFVITAAGTASPVIGAVVMAVFWAGTLPIMVGLGVGLQTLAGRLGRRLPMLTSVLLVVVGLFTIAGRLTAPAMALPPVQAGLSSVPDPEETESCPLCHPRSH